MSRNIVDVPTGDIQDQYLANITPEYVDMVEGRTGDGGYQPSYSAFTGYVDDQKLKGSNSNVDINGLHQPSQGPVVYDDIYDSNISGMDTSAMIKGLGGYSMRSQRFQKINNDTSRYNLSGYSDPRALGQTNELLYSFNNPPNNSEAKRINDNYGKYTSLVNIPLLSGYKHTGRYINKKNI